MRTCEYCGKSIVAKNAHARYCSGKCRVYAHRAAKRIPTELTSRDRWVRYSPSKTPLDAITGKNASSTNPETWASYPEAKTSTYGIGVGFVLGEGIGCIDIDHCINNGIVDQRALDLIDQTEHFYAEISPSGNGIHIWHHANEGPGTRRVENGLNVERYTTGRYITITGKRL